jgi:hypothetical protein
VNHCWVQNIFVTTGIKQLLQAETGFGYSKELILQRSAGNMVYAAAAMSELKPNECPNWSEYLSGYALCPFAGIVHAVQ